MTDMLEEVARAIQTAMAGKLDYDKVAKAAIEAHEKALQGLGND